MFLARLRVSSRSLASRLSTATLAAALVSGSAFANDSDSSKKHKKGHSAASMATTGASAVTHQASAPQGQASTAVMANTGAAVGSPQQHATGQASTAVMASTGAATQSSPPPTPSQASTAVMVSTGSAVGSQPHAATAVPPSSGGVVVVEQQPVVVQPAPMVVEPSLESRGRVAHIDVGASGGFNNPGGIIGGEVEYRPLDFVGVGVAGGTGAWGPRITPQVRLYPFGVSNFGLFLKGGLSLNLGGVYTVSINGNPVETVDMGFIPAANATIGIRQQWVHIFYTTLEAGWQFNLRPNAYKSRDGSQVDPISQGVLGFSQPGGFVIGGSMGFSFL